MPDIRKREAMEREAALLRRDCRRKLGTGIEKATVEVATVGVMEEVEIGTTIKEDIMGTDMVGEIIGVKRADIKIREVAMNDGMTVDTTGTNGVAQQMGQFTDHRKEVTLMTGMKMAEVTTEDQERRGATRGRRGRLVLRQIMSEMLRTLEVRHVVRQV